jgi:putative transposase
MAIAQRRPAKGLIVHSDRGSQFASTAYRRVLAAPDLIASIGRKGNCYPTFMNCEWPDPLRLAAR